MEEASYVQETGKKCHLDEYAEQGRGRVGRDQVEEGLKVFHT